MAALRFAPPLTKVLAATHNARRKRPLPTAFLAFVLLCSGSSMAEFLGCGIPNGLDWYMSSGVGLSPAASRRSTWKMRLFIFAAAAGASATGAACCSLVYRPLVAEVSVAERTLTPADRTAGPEKATETSQANVRTDVCSPADPGRVDDAGALPPDGAAPRTRGRPDCPNRAEVTAHHQGCPPQTWGQRWPTGQESGRLGINAPALPRHRQRWSVPFGERPSKGLKLSYRLPRGMGHTRRSVTNRRTARGSEDLTASKARTARTRIGGTNSTQRKHSRRNVCELEISYSSSALPRTGGRAAKTQSLSNTTIRLFWSNGL